MDIILTNEQLAHIIHVVETQIKAGFYVNSVRVKIPKDVNQKPVISVTIKPIDNQSIPIPYILITEEE